MLGRKVAKTRVHTGDRLQDEQQRRTDAVTDAVNALPWALGGRLVKGLTFAAGVPLTVTHGLRRKVTGYIITRSYGANVANAIGESGSGQPSDPTLQINLITTLAAKVDVFFF